MTMPETIGGAIFQCELGRDEVGEVMAASGIINLLRRAWGLPGRGGDLPAVVRADRRPRNQAAVPPARPGRSPRAGVHPEGRTGPPAARGWNRPPDP